MTGKTFGKTTDASARYSYRMRVSFSSVEYFTRVASTVRTRVCVEKSVIISGSSKTLFSLLTLTLALRFYIYNTKIYNCINFFYYFHNYNKNNFSGHFIIGKYYKWYLYESRWSYGNAESIYLDTTIDEISLFIIRITNTFDSGPSVDLTSFAVGTEKDRCVLNKIRPVLLMTYVIV